MKNILQNKLAVLAIASLAVVPVANAQSVPPLTEITNAATGQFGTFLTANAPALVGLALLVTGFKFVMKMIKKGIR